MSATPFPSWRRPVFRTRSRYDMQDVYETFAVASYNKVSVVLTFLHFVTLILGGRAGCPWKSYFIPWLFGSSLAIVGSFKLHSQALLNWRMVGMLLEDPVGCGCVTQNGTMQAWLGTRMRLHNCSGHWPQQSGLSSLVPNLCLYGSFQLGMGDLLPREPHTCAAGT